MRWSVIFIVVIALIGFILAADWTPTGDINLRGIYQIKNATNITAQYWCNSTVCYTMTQLLADTDTNTLYYAGGVYLYLNGSNYFFVNETKLNATIDARVTSTTYSGDNIYIYLDGVTFRFNETKMNNTVAVLIPDNLSQFVDDLGNRGYTSLSNFTNNMGFYNSTNINSSELQHQGDGKLGILDSFINALIDNRVVKAFVKALGFYDNTEVYNKTETYNKSQIDLNLTTGLDAQDACSEITGCVTSGTSNAWVISGENITAGTIADARIASTITRDSEVPSLETDSAHDTCTEVTGCVVGAITDANDTVNSTELDTICSTSGKILKRNATVWACADDEVGAPGAGDIEGVLAGPGLIGGGTTGTVTLNASADTCGANNVSKFNGTKFNCIEDNNTLYTAGTNLTLTGTTFAVNGTSLKNWLDLIYHPLWDFDFADLINVAITNAMIGANAVNTTQIIDGTIRNVDLNMTNITATPSNGDTSHLSTGDQIYDWVISLAYSAFGASVDDTEMTAEDFGGFTCTAGEDGCTIDSDGTWTLHNSYPAACSAGQAVTTIGDTNTCANFYDAEADLTAVLNDNYEPISAHFDASTTVNITCFNTACTWYMNATNSCQYWPSGGKDCSG